VVEHLRQLQLHAFVVGDRGVAEVGRVEIVGDAELPERGERALAVRARVGPVEPGEVDQVGAEVGDDRAERQPRLPRGREVRDHDLRVIGGGRLAPGEQRGLPLECHCEKAGRH
jgi:hypothetical protein